MKKIIRRQKHRHRRQEVTRKFAAMEPLEPRMLLSAWSDQHTLDPWVDTEHADHAHEALVRTEVINGTEYIRVEDFFPFELPALAAAPDVPADNALAPLSNLPILHSRPEARAKIHLDFDGHFVANWGSSSPGFTEAYDIDGDPRTFSSTEIQRIEAVWEHVSEDFAPFNINVTTEDPGTFANREAVKIVIGGDGAWSDKPSGGIALIGSFFNGAPNEAFVFSKNLGGVARSVGDASSHEVGHTFGLIHQSTWRDGVKTNEYDPGSGNWAPIMGTSYTAPFSTWHNGTSTAGPNSFQDDMALIASPTNGFGYLLDEAGDTTSSAVTLPRTNNTVDHTGVIDHHEDVDYYEVASSDVSIRATGFYDSPNLRMTLELRDAADRLIQSSLTGTNVTIEGSGHYLVVRSAGRYGGAGQYTLSGTVGTGPTSPNRLSAVPVAPDRTFVYWTAASDPTGDTITYELQYRKNDKSEPWSDPITTPSTSKVIAGLVEDTTYEGRVRSSDGEDVSKWKRVRNLFNTGSYNPHTKIIGEVGKLTDLTHVPQTVTLDHAFANPVVFAQSPSNHGGAPISVRVSNVSSNQFTIYLAEPSNKDGQHEAVTITYLVVEAGVHELLDDRWLEVGTVRTGTMVGSGRSKVWETITYTTTFSQAPVLLTQIQTNDHAGFLNVRQTPGTVRSGKISLQTEEGNTNAQTTETVGYLAVESGFGWSGLPVEAYTTSKKVTDVWFDLQFDQIHEAVPNFLSSLASSTLLDNANLRYRKLSASHVQVRVQEDTTADEETNHGKEKVAYLAIGESGLILADDSPQPPTVPGAPSTTVVKTDGALIEWPASTDPDNDPITYEVQFRRDTAGAAWSDAIITASTSITLTGLADNTTYGIRLRASDGALQSDWITMKSLFSTALFLRDKIAIGEAGRLTNVTHIPQAVTLARAYDNPVVFAQSPSNAGRGPIAVRVTDVQANRFTIYVAEPSNKDGIHGAVTVRYVVLEAGHHELADGRRLEVGTVSTGATAGTAFSNTWETIAFAAAFTAKPVVLTQIQTDLGTDFLYTRQKPGTLASFNLTLQQEQSASEPHGPETVGYLVIEPGTGFNGLTIEAYTTRKIVTHDWHVIPFGQAYTDAPHFLSSLASTGQPDSANLRYRKLTGKQVEVRVQEDTTADAEVVHGKEKVSYLALDGDGPILAVNIPMPPTAPGPPSATVIDPESALLQWTASTDPNSDPIRYEVQYRKDDRRKPWRGPLTTTNDSLVLTGLDPGTRYRVRIRALNEGSESAWVKVNNLFQTPVNTGSSPGLPTLLNTSNDSGTITKR